MPNDTSATTWWAEQEQRLATWPQTPSVSPGKEKSLVANSNATGKVGKGKRGFV